MPRVCIVKHSRDLWGETSRMRPIVSNHLFPFWQPQLSPALFWFVFCFPLCFFFSLSPSPSLSVYLFWHKVLLCTLDWPQTCGLISKTLICWDYRCISPCPVSFAFSEVLTISMHLFPTHVSNSVNYLSCMSMDCVSNTRAPTLPRALHTQHCSAGQPPVRAQSPESGLCERAVEPGEDRTVCTWYPLLTLP